MIMDRPECKSPMHHYWMRPAAAEAMAMLYSSRSRESADKGANKFFVSDECFRKQSIC